MSFNSCLGHFAPAYFEGGLLFATKSLNKGFLTGRYAWDDAFFTNVTYTEKSEGQWTKPKALSGEFFSRKHDGPVAFNSEKNKMLITQNLSGKEKKEGVRYISLYTSIRNQNGEWGALKVFPYSTKESNTGHGCYSLDDKRVYFVSDREGSLGKTDVFYSDLKNGEWQAPVNFERINTEGEEMFPFVSKDNRLYFASNGRLGLGGLDIYYINLNDENSIPVNVGAGINSAADDFGIIVNDTLPQGYFSSNRNDFIDRIYSWKRNAPEIDVKINVFANYKEKEPIKDQEVLLIDIQTNDTIVLVTNDEGSVSTNVDLGKDYTIRVNKPFFELDEKVDFNTHTTFNDTSMVYDMMMNPTFISARIHVIRESDKSPISNAAISLYNPKTKKDTMLYTDESGFVTGLVDRHSAYRARASKKGYLDEEASFLTNNYSDKQVELELSMTKIKKGEIFKLENIFYDVDKATLREESKVALDKLASFLISNDVKIELSSHTDSRGGNSYNVNLSQRRAQSCVDYMVNKGVPKSDIVAKGYGETKLVNKCSDGVNCSEEEHQANRRTEVKILEVN
jgi:outer membrane protein OmpA-like peptidoglycan-associated protein